MKETRWRQFGHMSEILLKVLMFAALQKAKGNDEILAGYLSENSFIIRIKGRLLPL